MRDYLQSQEPTCWVGSNLADMGDLVVGQNLAALKLYVWPCLTASASIPRVPAGVFLLDGY